MPPSGVGEAAATSREPPGASVASPLVHPSVPSRPLPGPLSVTVLTAVAAGGAIGALARYGVDRALVDADGDFVRATFLVNVLGCLAIGLIAGPVLRRRSPVPRAFLVTGVLGGFTTFSAYVVDARVTAVEGSAGTALLYLGATLVVGLVAVRLGLAIAGRGAGGSAAAGDRAPEPDA
jgi:CrcB protein